MPILYLKCILEKRINRSGFFFVTLTLVVVYILTILILGVVIDYFFSPTVKSSEDGLRLLFLYIFPIFISCSGFFIVLHLLTAAKRLHDFNQSASWLFMPIICVLLIFPLSLIKALTAQPADLFFMWKLGFAGYLVFSLIIMIIPGSKDSNIYGPKPDKKTPPAVQTRGASIDQNELER